FDQLERVLGEVPARGDDETDGLAHVADRPAGERRLKARRRAGALPESHRDARDRAEIGGGDDRDHAGKCPGGLRADGRDARVRMRRAQDRGVQEAGQPHVRRVFPAPGQKPEVLLALDGKADDALMRKTRGSSRRAHGSRWKMRAAFSPRIAASVAPSRPASRTTRSGSGSPSQKGWSLPSMTRSWPTS